MPSHENTSFRETAIAEELMKQGAEKEMRQNLEEETLFNASALEQQTLQVLDKMAEIRESGEIELGLKDIEILGDAEPEITLDDKDIQIIGDVDDEDLQEKLIAEARQLQKNEKNKLRKNFEDAVIAATQRGDKQKMQELHRVVFDKLPARANLLTEIYADLQEADAVRKLDENIRKMQETGELKTAHDAIQKAERGAEEADRKELERLLDKFPPEDEKELRRLLKKFPPKE